MKSYFCLILLFTITSLSAQKKYRPTTESIVEATKLKTEFPEADIAIAASKSQISFGYENGEVTVNQTKNERLINLAPRSDIRYYEFYDGMSNISRFHIKNRSNKKAYYSVEDEAYTSSGLFHNDSRVKYTIIDFPEFAYEYNFTVHKNYKDIKYFTSIYFNDEYPVNRKEIIINVPDWLDVEFKEINFDGYDIEKTITADSRKKLTIHTYIIKDVISYTEEENTQGPSYIYPHLLVLAKSHNKQKETTNIFKSTQDQYNWYKSLVNGLENKNDSYKNKVVELTKNIKTDEEKIKNIYYWVQDNIRYIAFENGIAGFKPDEASSVYTKRYGDCKGMANLTKAMLTEAGFDARLTWIGTKHIAYDYSTPNLAVDNHMICTLMLDGKTIYLDATEKYNSFGEYANRIQGKQVLIENGDKYLLNNVPETTADSNLVVTNYNVTINGEDLKAVVSKNFKGESRAELLNYLNSIKTNHKEDFINYYLNEGSNNIKVRDIKTSDIEDRDIDVIMNYKAHYKGNVSSFDGIVYIDLDFDKELSKFTIENRFTDYVFPYKRSINTTTTLNIPEGYKVDQLPKNFSVDKDNYKLSLTFKQEGNTITYKKYFSIKNGVIEATDFKDWNTSISSIKAIYDEQIILSKS